MSDAERLTRELMGVQFEAAPPPVEAKDPTDMTGVLELMASLAAVDR